MIRFYASHRVCFLLSFPLAIAGCWLWSSAILSVPTRVGQVVVDGKLLANVEAPPLEPHENPVADEADASQTASDEVAERSKPEAPHQEPPVEPPTPLAETASSPAEPAAPEPAAAEPAAAEPAAAEPAAAEPAAPELAVPELAVPEPAAAHPAESLPVTSTESPAEGLPQPAAAESLVVGGASVPLPGDAAGIWGTMTTSEGGGPLLNVQLVGRVSFSQPPRWRGYHLVALRTRRTTSSVEVVSLDGELLNGPLPLAEFARRAGQPSLNRGVVLADNLLVPIQDRLLPLGGGWQAWLLLEESVWNGWQTAIQDALRRRNLAWSQVGSLIVRLEPVWNAPERGPRLIVAEIAPRPADPPVANQPPLGERS